MIRTALQILVMFSVAILLAALQATSPPYAMLTGPIRTTGQQRETVSSQTFSVKVRRVLKAKTIGFAQFGKRSQLQTSGVWMVVSAEVQAFQETMPVRAATLVGSSGRLYRQSRRAGAAANILSAKVVQPGLPTTGIFVFELPDDETGDMKLILSEQYDPQLKDEISVSLEANGMIAQNELEIGKDGV